MPIYELTQEALAPVPETSFSVEQLTERGDLQRLLRDRIDVVAPGCLVLAEEFGSWDDSRRRIDLLLLDRNANLLVVELKRTADGGLMDLQAVRYAAMVSTMTFDQAVNAHAAYLEQRGTVADARETLLDFLGWEEPIEDDFAQRVQIVLVAADFSRELTTAVLWLNEHDLDIRCVRLKPYTLDGRVLLDVAQVIPLPEANEYQVRVREKVRKEREQRAGGRDLTKYDVAIDGTVEQRLPKRRAAYAVIRAVCDAGVSPEAVHEVFSWRAGGLWRVVEGEVGAEEFHEKATAAAEAGGPAFDPRRWFCEEHELIRHDGRTYALSNGWGGPKTEQGLRELAQKYPQAGVAIEPSRDED